MKLESVQEDYEIKGDRKNIIAALRRRGFTVTRRPAINPTYLICAGNPKESQGAISNLVGRIVLSETFPIEQRFEIYGPSKYFDKLKSFAQEYQSQRKS
jgi:hypothetical protein